MKIKNIVQASLLTASVFAGVISNAMPNVGGRQARLATNAGPGAGTTTGLKGTAAACLPATAKVDLDINNVRARLMTGGDMWWDPGLQEAKYEVPKGSRKNSLFAGSLWVGGKDPQGQLKVAAQTYRQNGNDYWPGPLDAGATADKSSCSEWDQFWKINKSDIIAFQSLVKAGQVPRGDSRYDAIFTWPAKGNASALGVSGLPLNELNNGRDYAPFIDVDGDGKYDPTVGDYPGDPASTDKQLPGDQYIWWVYNDAGNAKLESQTASIGLEVQASAFAFGTKDFLNDATFYNYRLINRGSGYLDSTFVATWTDADLGDASDDFIGCDTSRSLGIIYNGRSVDGNGQVNSYGSQVPMCGVDFFVGPKAKIMVGGVLKDTVLGMSIFSYFNNVSSGALRNPNGGSEIYNYMSGTDAQNEHIRYDFKGAGIQVTGFSSGPVTRAVYSGDADPNLGQWSECTCGNTPGDRRFIHSAGPFRLEGGGVTNNITIGAVWVSDVGGCPNTSFKKIRSADDQAQELFDNGFKTIEGPEAPKLVVREQDRKLIFYIVNDSNSTNFLEKFGYDTAAKYRVSSPKTRRGTDSLYKFEGYRVFQVKDASVQPAQIFNDLGETDNTVAREVFQTDIKNGISRIVNYDRSTIADSIYNAVVKVTGKDSGIQHSFALTDDKFSTNSDKRFVNYRNYYFVAIAYAYNNFRSFDISKPDSTQETAYLESSHAGGGLPISVVAAMPNPAQGNMGTVINGGYGDGVIIQRIEGTGNGHNILQIDQASENTALTSPDYRVYQPVYKAGSGPINVKVIDPDSLKRLSFKMYINGPITAGQTDDGIKANDPATNWVLVSSANDTVYSENHLGSLNEQILQKFGLSVSIMQVVRPGRDQVNGNGYITSDVTFADPGKAWLAGVNDAEQRSPLNWIRSGRLDDPIVPGTNPTCDYSDNHSDTVIQAYEQIFANNSLLKGTWTAYNQAASTNSGSCGFGVALSFHQQPTQLLTLPSVDLVFTSNKALWTRCIVVELEDDATLSEGGAAKFRLRKHPSWDLNINSDGSPVYNTSGDSGRSWFPGYAINQESGQRLNIVMGEDSWLKTDNGSDLIWNPSSKILNENGNVIFGGKHYVYIQSTKYDKGEVNYALQKGSYSKIFDSVQWVGLPTLAPGFQFTSLNDGLIPTETRLRFRVDRPYARDILTGSGITLQNQGLPLYTFSTVDIAPRPLTDAANHLDKDSLLDQIFAVPNPYYGYSGYEVNRLDTKVRIINLPHRATINIYSLDGSLVRRVEKTDLNVSYVDWDIRNAKGLPVASGMYLMHVKAEGIGETVIKWFGSMRPIDITTF